MARPLRIEYPGAWYHVMNRGRRSEEIFFDKKDYLVFVNLIKELVELWGVNISAYCLMSNHYHILLQTPKGNLSRVMRHLNSIYTQRFNARHGLDGSLFKGRYKSILVHHDSYLLELTRYIHQNPVKAGMVKKMEDYSWSSYKGYLSYSKGWDWLYKDIVFSMITKKKKGRLKPFIEFMEKDESGEISSIFSSSKLPSILGPKDFITKIREKYYFDNKLEDIPDVKILSPDPDVIIKNVCLYYKVNTSDLMIKRRGWFNKARDVSIYLIRYICNETLNDIAELFEMNTYSAVSSAYLKVKVLINKDKKIKKDIEHLINKISKGQKQT
ncbi:MAG: transposase [Desulfobacterales bacterium]|nr:transposase [Desulfobacterales bacterium]